MNKRDLFKGLVGATIAGPDAMRTVMDGSRHPPQQPRYYGIDKPSRIYPSSSPLQEAFDAAAHEATKAMHKQINQQRELLSNQINHQIYAIKRQKSTFEAYKDYMIAKLERDRTNVFNRAQQLMNAVWGNKAPDDGPSEGQAAGPSY